MLLLCVTYVTSVTYVIRVMCAIYVMLLTVL
jgi:hypothetical protein